MPRYHEASPQRSLRDSDSVGKIWQKDKLSTHQVGSLTRSVTKMDREIQKMKRRIVGGAGVFAGWHFESQIEVDPTVYYPAQTVIHIQPTNDLVVTGIRDAANPTGGLITSCAGFWVSTQDVPAKSVVSGHDVWNLPQWPLPVGTNYDDPLNFWLYLGSMDC